MPLTFKDVAEILKLIDASECDEVVLELEGMRLVVRRNAAGSAEASFTPGPGETPETITASEISEHHQSAVPPAKVPASSAGPGLTDIRAPMVGTFYRRPSPEEPPFVEEGSKVEKGDPLCLIEVMKLFTTIEAPAEGTVVLIFPDDETLVEFNQLLFRIGA